MVKSVYYTVLAEGQSLIPNMQVKWLTNYLQLQLQGDLVPLASTGTCTHKQTHMYTYITSK